MDSILDIWHFWVKVSSYQYIHPQGNQTGTKIKTTELEKVLELIQIEVIFEDFQEKDNTAD